MSDQPTGRTVFKYTVLLQQYVENLARMEVEAETPEQARDIALREAHTAVWVGGTDAYDPDVYLVRDATGADVWERVFGDIEPGK
jgi:hypothetical protein